MPFASPKQRRMIFAKASQGVPWARKFIADAGAADNVPPAKRGTSSARHRFAKTMASKNQRRRRRRRH